jgi:uncharacterized protein (DUF488 family)
MSCSTSYTVFAESSLTVYTIGHSTRTIAEFVALLQQVRVDTVVDVRAFPRSRTNPQFNAAPLTGSLTQAGMTYRHLRALGGRRHRNPDAPPSPNTLWRNEAFRNYADYAATDPFRAGMDELRTLIGDHCCAVMCAEAVWWRCHRRIIADYLLAEGIPVAHILGRDKITSATLTPGVRRLSGGTLVYSGGEANIVETIGSARCPSLPPRERSETRRRHRVVDE